MYISSPTTVYCSVRATKLAGARFESVTQYSDLRRHDVLAFGRLVRPSQEEGWQEEDGQLLRRTN